MVSAAVTVFGADSKNTSVTTGANSGNKAANTSFDKVMSASLSSGTKNKSYSDANTINKKDGIQDIKSQNTDGVKTMKHSNDDQTVNSKSENVSANNNVDNGNSDKVESAIDELVEDVKKKIQEIFNVSDEQLQDAMEMLGMSMMDLLQPDKLTQLVVAVNGQNDTLSILIDENLSSGLQDLLNFVNEETSQMAEEFGISTEELAQIIETASQDEQKVDFNVPKADENYNENIKAAEKYTKEVQVQSDDDVNANDSLENVIESKITASDNKTSDNSNNFDSNQNASKNTEVVSDNSIASNLAQNITNSFNDVMVNVGEEINAVDIVRQVVDAVKVTATQQLTNIEVALNPENLGKITMNVSAKNGVVTAQLVAENEQVKHALESQMITLKERFENQGIRVDAVEVTVQSHSFEANENLKGNDSDEQNGKRKGNGHIRLDSLDDLDENDMSEEEIRARDLINNGVSSVEYTA